MAGAQCTNDPSISPNSPFLLHLSDNPVMKLVSLTLNGVYILKTFNDFELVC